MSENTGIAELVACAGAAAIAAAARVRVMGFDVDGVLTDGLLHYGPSGDEMKTFSTLDGHGMRLLAANGVKVVIITARTSQALRHRADNLGIAPHAVLTGVTDKRSAMAHLLEQHGLDFSHAGYMGDDLMDLPLMRACAFSAGVASGHALVRRHAAYIASAPAGRGAVREVAELILAAQDKLDAIYAEALQ